MHASETLFEMPSPFESEPGRLLLLEPSSADAAALAREILGERYNKPFVLDDGERRYLYFSMRLMQSAMLKRDPNALELRYTQKMMLFLLFVSLPRRIVLIGLGGGSLLKFCHRHLSGAHISAIELDPDVIALRSAFALPADGPRLEIHHADGADFIGQAEPGIDVLLVDAFDKRGFAESLGSREFFESAASKLGGKGVLVVNLAGARDSYAGLTGAAMDTFDDRVIVMSVPEDGNHLLLAFNDPGFAPDWRRLRSLARQLGDRYQLDFAGFVEKLERSDKLGLARREALRGR